MMKNLLLVLPIVLLFTACSVDSDEFLAPTAQAEERAKRPKIDICHNGHVININMNAWPAHRAHGDVRLDDQDGDGFVPDNPCGFGNMGDCDDMNPNINPGAIEICDNGIDDDCDGDVDDNDDDCCDAQGYATVELNGKTWLAENLNINTANSYCLFNNNSNCNTYGRMYTYDAAQLACGQLGDCWRVPTKEELDSLVLLYDPVWDLGNIPNASSSAAYPHLIDGGSSGFDMLFGGARRPDGLWVNPGGFSSIWSSSETNSTSAWRFSRRGAGTNPQFSIARSIADKDFALYCRCIKDES